MKITRRRAALLALAASAAAGAWLWRWSRGSADFLLCRLALEYELLMKSDELYKEARSGNSQAYYFTSYYLNGLLSAFEATGDERLLRRSFKLMDAMVDAAKDFEEDGRVFRVWGPFWVRPESPAPRPQLHFTFQAAVPFARAAAIVSRDPELALRFGARADRYYRFVDNCVFDYFFEQQLKRKIPWINPEDFPHWNDNGSNLALNAAFMCEARGRSRHCVTARIIGAAFKDKLRVYKTGWIWENQTIPIGSDTDNTPGSVGNQGGVPDVSHTNREAFLMQTLHEMGLLFSRSDLERMAGTFTDLMWNGSLDEPAFSNYMNGNDEPYRVYKKPGLNGSIYHGWAFVGAYSPKAQEALVATLKAILKGRMNPSLERNKTSYGGVMALAGHALRNFGRATRPRGALKGR
jgi:hypothetical protein